MDGFTNIIQSHLVVVDSAFFKAHKRYAALLVLPRWQDFLTTSSRPMQWARVMPREPMPRESSSNLDARCWTQHDVRSRDAYRKDLFIDCCSSARITWNTPFETGATEGVRRRSDLKRCQCALRSFCSSVFLLLLKLDCISSFFFFLLLFSVVSRFLSVVSSSSTGCQCVNSLSVPYFLSRRRQSRTRSVIFFLLKGLPTDLGCSGTSLLASKDHHTTEVGGASSRHVSLYYTASLVSFTMPCTWVQLHDGIGGVASRLCVRAFCCYLQASISSAIKPFNGRFDLGLLKIGDLSKGYIDLDTNQTLKGRMPPLSPARVEQKLKDEMKFTNRSDVKKVVKLYTSFFVTVSSSTEELA